MARDTGPASVLESPSFALNRSNALHRAGQGQSSDAAAQLGRYHSFDNPSIGRRMRRILAGIEVNRNNTLTNMATSGSVNVFDTTNNSGRPGRRPRGNSGRSGNSAPTVREGLATFRSGDMPAVERNENAFQSMLSGNERDETCSDIEAVSAADSELEGSERTLTSTGRRQQSRYDHSGILYIQSGAVFNVIARTK